MDCWGGEGIVIWVFLFWERVWGDRGAFYVVGLNVYWACDIVIAVGICEGCLFAGVCRL